MKKQLYTLGTLNGLLKPNFSSQNQRFNANETEIFPPREIVATQTNELQRMTKYHGKVQFRWQVIFKAARIKQSGELTTKIVDIIITSDGKIISKINCQKSLSNYDCPREIRNKKKQYLFATDWYVIRLKWLKTIFCFSTPMFNLQLMTKIAPFC